MWTSILSFALTLLGFILDRISAGDETKKAFLDFINHLEEKQLIPTKVRESYKAQLERLKKEQK